MAMISVPDAGKKYLACLIGAALAAPAMAQDSLVSADTFQPFAAAMVNYDDNLLRRDMSRRPDADYSDTYTTSVFGLGFNRPIGRQLLTANAKVSRVSFNRFSQLDYNGKDAMTDLDWRVGNRFSGHVGAKYVEALASFADFQTTELNVRTVKSVYANGKWQFHPSWRVATGYTRDDYHFDLESQRFNNRTETSADVGFDYLASSGSTVGLMLRRLKGDYEFAQQNGANTVIDNGYSQDELNLNVNWTASGVTQVTFLGGWARRESNGNSIRNVSGGRGRLIANWSPRVSLQLSAAVWRDFYASEGLFVNSAVAVGSSLDARWLLTSKINLTGQLRTEKRDFQPLPGVSASADLSDRTNQATLGVSYQPLRALTLGLNAFRTSRDGSAAAFTNSYRAKGIGFSASVKF